MDAEQDNNIPDRPRPGSTTTVLSIDKHQDEGVKCATGAKTAWKPPTKNITIGTWNVRTLHACGKVKELEHELARYKWDILGLAEARWAGFGETTTEDGHRLWYSGDEKKHQRNMESPSL